MVYTWGKREKGSLKNNLEQKPPEKEENSCLYGSYQGSLWIWPLVDFSFERADTIHSSSQPNLWCGYFKLLISASQDKFSLLLTLLICHKESYTFAVLTWTMNLFQLLRKKTNSSQYIFMKVSSDLERPFFFIHTQECIFA